MIDPRSGVLRDRSAALTVRRATIDDMWWVYDVAMDPTTRAMSTRSERFSREQHATWYHRRLIDPDQLFLIGLRGGERIGYLRFGRATARELAAVDSPRTEDRASTEVGIAIAPDHRGRGHAAPLLITGEVEVRARWKDVRRLVALILPANLASLSAFSRAGYSRTGEELRLGKRHEVFEKLL